MVNDEEDKHGLKKLRLTFSRCANRVGALLRQLRRRDVARDRIDQTPLQKNHYEIITVHNKAETKWPSGISPII